MCCTTRVASAFLPALALALGVASAGPAAAQDCVGFFDDLLGGAPEAGGIQQGGRWTAEGWEVTANSGDYILWKGLPIGTEGRFEFEVKGLGVDQPCGECMLWWFAANDLGDLDDQLRISDWAASGRRFGPELDCVDCETDIDKVKMKVWCTSTVLKSDTTFDWQADAWYHMTITWQDEQVSWHRRTLPDGPDQLLVEFTRRSCVWNPETAGATNMAFLVGSWWLVATEAVFRNVAYTPLRCPASTDADADADVPADVPAEAEAEAGADADVPAEAEAEAGADPDSGDVTRDGDGHDVDTGICPDGLCPVPESPDHGCGCSTPGRNGASPAVAVFLLALSTFLRRRRCR
ncbi:MAG: hypothetical protein JXB32_18380 [Deltaproteobacteria bacterium]|nr:hypothetical protein [Deltaproteobacteria bacterium]